MKISNISIEMSNISMKISNASAKKLKKKEKVSINTIVGLES